MSDASYNGYYSLAVYCVEAPYRKESNKVFWISSTTWRLFILLIALASTCLSKSISEGFDAVTAVKDGTYRKCMSNGSEYASQY